MLVCFHRFSTHPLVTLMPSLRLGKSDNELWTAASVCLQHHITCLLDCVCVSINPRLTPQKCEAQFIEFPGFSFVGAAEKSGW